MSNAEFAGGEEPWSRGGKQLGKPRTSIAQHRRSKWQRTRGGYSPSFFARGVSLPTTGFIHSGHADFSAAACHSARLGVWSAATWRKAHGTLAGGLALSIGVADQQQPRLGDRGVVG